MAKQTTVSQQYPRIDNSEEDYYGFLDEGKLKPHQLKIARDVLSGIIEDAIAYASQKSSRALLNIPVDASDEVILKHHKKAGRDLFLYFKKYCGDPATSAFDCEDKHYSIIAREQFRNRTIQKERMNAGWRYQSIAKDAAMLTKRFDMVSDIGTAEADFNVIIRDVVNNKPITIYVSVKNRTNTMGGQDWPKAIRALEDVAKTDKNRTGSYICVFGIAIDKGKRVIRLEGKTKQPYSVNTEVWMSDFFWPFFSNFEYDELMKAVFDVVKKSGEKSSLDVEIPMPTIEEFGAICSEYRLLDDDGKFNDAYKLIDLFCGKLKEK